MQRSFWKTVAVVGVIGIGTLTILEVQNRLRKQPTVAENANDLAKEVVGTGDKTVNAMLSESDFEKLIHGDNGDNGDNSAGPSESDGQATFNLQEPIEPLVAAAASGNASDDRFYSSEPVPPQEITPPVNTAVRSQQLVQGGNPFADDGATVAASYQTSGRESVEPVGFVPETSDTPEPQQESGFAFFGDDSEPSKLAQAAPKSISTSELTPTPEKFDAAGKFEFFGSGGESTTSNPTHASGSQPAAVATLAATAQFYSEDAPATGTNPGFDNDSPMFGGDDPAVLGTPSPTSPTSPPSSSPPATREFSPFDAEPGQPLPPPAGSANPPSSTQPEFDSREFSNDNSDPVPFSEDPVPLPRNPVVPDFGSSEPPARLPAGRPPEAVPVRPTPEFGDGALPWVEDGPSGSRPESVPDLESPGSLSIPGMNNTFPETPRSDREFEPGFDSRPAPVPESDPFDGRPGSSPSRDSFPIRNYNEPGIRNGNGVREFNGGTREFNGGGSGFDPAPSGFDNPSRPFEPDSPSPAGNDRLDNDRGFENFDSNTPSRDNRGLNDRDQLDRRIDDRAPSNGLFENSDPRNRSLEDRRIIDRTFENRSPESSGPEIRSRGARQESDLRQVSGTMRPNLVLQKTAPKNATVGTPLEYKIYVKNEGDATAYDVVVDDEVTSAAKVEAAHPQSDYDTAARKLVWRFAEIRPGGREEITVQVTPTGEGVLDGVASVKFKSRVQATTVVTAPKLRLQMEGPNEVRLGEEVAYRYIITNEGSGEARNVFVRTLLPAGGGLKHAQGRDLEYEISAMKPGEQREIVLAVVAGEPGEHKAEAEVSAAGGTADQAAWRTKVVGSQLQIVRRGPKRRFVNRSATYENIITNETNFEALDAKVVEKIPQGMRFMGATMGGKYDKATHTVTWLINRLGPGLQEQLQLELMPTQAGNMESVVTIMENVGIQREGYVSTTVVEDLHNVSATISQLDGPVPMGEPFGFTINIDNRGTADATDVSLRIELPEEIRVIGAGSQELRARKLLDGNTVQYDVIHRIEPNRKQSFELKLQGQKPIRNGLVKALVQYKQMSDPLIVSESVTIYREEL